MNNFDEYIRLGEPDKIEKSQIWQTAIGLQQVDGLTPSDYLIETAKQNIEGDITFEEVKSRIDTYYQTLHSRGIASDAQDDRTEEADKVSSRIAEILSSNTFSFSPVEYINIHRQLFAGIYKFAGKIRDYDISKKEWVLNGKSVMYASALNLRETLEYDFKEEKAFDYKGLSQQQIVEHIAHFVAYLWQIHVFGEGNTRTTAVFTIKYLRKLGFENISNDLFAAHSWYFRNALVRANYENITQGIHRTDKYLVRFLSNLLLGENNILKNRELHISFVETKKLEANENTTNTLGVNASVNGEGTVVRKWWSENGGQKKWSENIGKLFDLISAQPDITRKEMAEQLQINPSAVQKHIEKLKKEGIITREGSDKKGSWKINDSDK
ncbi:MAG: Fic family protein [Candidatus Symbiothrix sp.]|jgi:fido (protein-threonine AMPylation protein)|nr:Fic family protein [Candidatus Symbiothrix sp.]